MAKDSLFKVMQVAGLSRGILFIIGVVVFVLFFGLTGDVFAAECSYTNPNTVDCTITITFTDPGGSGLEVCEYKIEGVTGWQSDWNLGSVCIGSTATMKKDLDISQVFSSSGSGEYQIKWNAEDKIGNKAEGDFKKIEVLFPPTAPSVPDLVTASDTGEKNYDDITNDITPTFTGTGETGATITLYRGGVEQFPTTTTTPTVQPDGTWEVELNDVDDNNKFLADSSSTYSYTARASNTGGSSNDSDPLDVTVDLILPREATNLLSTSHVTSQWSNDNTVNVSWERATDTGSGLDGYSVAWDESATTVPNISRDIQEDIISDVSPVLSNGILHYFHIRSLDIAGNWDTTAADLGPFWIDVIAPTMDTFTIDGQSFPEEVNTGSQVTIAWTASDTGGSGIDHYEVWRTRIDGDPNSWETEEDKGPIIPDATSGVTDNPGDGTWWYGVHVVDDAENRSTEADAGLGPIKVIFDATPPAVPTLNFDGSDTGIFDSDNVTKDDTPSFSGGGENGSIVTLYRNGEPINTPTGTVSGGVWSINLVTPQQNGTNVQYTARAKDAFDNESGDSNAWTITIDTTKPPEPNTCNFPCSGQVTTKSPTLSWTTVDDNPGLSTSSPIHYRLQISTNSGFSGIILDQDKTRGSFALGSTLNTLADGTTTTSGLFLEYGSTYHWRLQTEDGAGNVSAGWSPVWSFKVVRPVNPPTVSTTSASSIGETSAALNGYLDSDGGEASDVRFNWGTTTAYGNDTSWLNNKSSGTSFSWIVSGLQDDTLYHYRAEATNSAGTSFGADRTFTTLISNRPPSISSVNDSPDPIAADSNLNFNVFWLDPDGDSVKLFVCKSASGVAGGTCSGGVSNEWCKDTSPTSSSPATCTYITDAADSGINNYYAYVCDGDNECSSSSFGTFTVDATSPGISSFSVTPEVPLWVSNASPDVTVLWTVTEESGGSFLREVQVWRSGNGGGSWSLVSTVSAPSSSTSWTSSTMDAPSSGVYLYGLHAVDNVGNETTESEAGFSPISVQVDITDPSAGFREPPVAGTWFKDDFDVTFDDGDLGGSGLVSTCEYKFFGSNPDGSDEPSGILSRQCNFDTKSIAVGEGEVCQFEGSNRCKVHTRAFDNAGNDSGWQIEGFGVDFTDPVITNIQPSTVQVGAVSTFTADLTDPIGHVTGCALWTAPLGSPEWTSDPAVIDPIPCENGDACTVSGDHTFPSTGEYDVQFACTDQAGNTGWGVSTARADTLSVVGEAIPSSGTQQTQFDLKATVSGTMEGTINYKFDCTSDGIWDLEVSGASPYTAEDLCSYSPPDTYTAKVLVERGIGSAEDTVDIIISLNASPSAINLQDNNGTADYCFTGAPPIILSWDFDDPNLPGDSQTAYQVQVDINAGFSTPEIDSGKVTSSSSSYVPVGLLYDETYWWRVTVWDEEDDPSVWATGTSFTTPAHAYPWTDFTWSPTFPTAEEEVQFTDQTIFSAGSTNQSWSWDFGDASSSTEQNPTHAYAEMISHTVQITVSDDAGSCALSQKVRVSVPLPEWLEISPF